MNGRPWTQDHTATLKAMAGHAYDHEIAKATGHHPDTVQRHRSFLGIPAYHGTRCRYGTFLELPAMSSKAIRAACDRVGA